MTDGLIDGGDELRRKKSDQIILLYKKNTAYLINAMDSNRRMTMKNSRLLLVAGVLFGSISLNAPDGMAMSPEGGGGTSIVISSQPRFINIPDQGFSVSIGSPMI